MPWIYFQASGDLISPEGKRVATGYAGHGKGVNNPAMESVVKTGPIPRGRWSIGPPRDSGTTGPYSLILEPLPGTNTFERSAFRIHGDNNKGNRSASEGCIIVPRSIREEVWASGDHVIEVK